MDELACRFSKEQLHQITAQAMIYMCACPAQVARQILHLRELYDYQRLCVGKAGLLDTVHDCIAEATRLAHTGLEQCLDDVLDLEGWDRATLSMPEGLRRLREDMVSGNGG